jgi:hypothetical protein
MRNFFSILGGVLLALAWASPSRADLTFTGGGSAGSDVSPDLSLVHLATFLGKGSDGSHALQAEVSFRVSGNHLVIDLSNTATFTTIGPSDILTAVYLDIKGNPKLTNPTAVVTATSVLFQTPGQSLLKTPASLMLKSTPGGWDYEFGGTQSVSQSYGFGTAGLDRFAGGTSSGGRGGPGNYGIVQDETFTSFSGDLKNKKKPTDLTPLVKSTVEFTLSGLPTTFKLSDISHVRFQYGTSTGGEPSFSGTPFLGQPQIQANAPEPSSLVLAALGAFGFLGYGVRKRIGK